MGVKKHVLRYLIGCQKGCQKTLINKGLFFDTLRVVSAGCQLCVYVRTTTPDTADTDKRKLTS